MSSRLVLPLVVIMFCVSVTSNFANAKETDDAHIQRVISNAKSTVVEVTELLNSFHSVNYLMDLSIRHAQTAYAEAEFFMLSAKAAANDKPDSQNAQTASANAKEATEKILHHIRLASESSSAQMNVWKEMVTLKGRCDASYAVLLERYANYAQADDSLKEEMAAIVQSEMTRLQSIAQEAMERPYKAMLDLYKVVGNAVDVAMQLRALTEEASIQAEEA